MGRYDFLDDEETKKKLEERQKSIITQKKQEEVRRGKEGKEGKAEEEETGPKVYTKDTGEIGGVIYPKEIEQTGEKPSEQLMGKKGREKKREEGNPRGDLPIKLYHTEDTKVGTADRPSPPEKSEPEEVKKVKEKREEELGDEAKKEIWQ